MVDVLFVNSFGLRSTRASSLHAGTFRLLGWSVWYTHRRGRVYGTHLLLAHGDSAGIQFLRSVTIRAAVNPPMNSNDPSNPHALSRYSTATSTAAGRCSTAPLFGARSRASSSRHALRGLTRPATTMPNSPRLHPSAAFMHLFPRMWNYSKRPRRNTNSGRPIAPSGDAARRTRATSCATRRERRCAARYSTSASNAPTRRSIRAAGHHGADLCGESDPLLLLPAQLHVLALFHVELRRPSERHTASRTTITDGNWLSGVASSIGNTSAAGTTCRAKSPKTRAGNTYYFLPFLLGLIGLVYQLNRDPAQLLDRAVAVRDDGHRAGRLLQHFARRTRERDYVYAGSFYAFSDLDRIRACWPSRPDRRLSKRDNVRRQPRQRRRNERPGHPRGPELGRPRPFAPHLCPRYRLELPPVDASQFDHPQLRRQRHLPAVAQSGGRRRCEPTCAS